HETEFDDRIPMQAYADVIVNAAHASPARRRLDELSKLLRARSQIPAPKQFDQSKGGELRCAGQATEEDIESAADVQRGLVNDAGVDLAAQISAPQIRIGLLNARDGVGDRLRLLAIDTRGLLQDASEGRLSEALLFGKISSSEIRLALRREKHRKRPSTVVAERVRGGLIDLI